ncbi:MAG: tetratricopeptide repeat protein [Methanomassiliicoccales archaeon]|nr:tetratricopeptide repeat protein [Methanomassiliicoccales archaeon]
MLTRWRAEAGSRPTEEERAVWQRTIDLLIARSHSENDHRELADIHHRLFIAHLKLQDYANALGWAEKGLLLNVVEWRPRFQEAKAEALYMMGREAEAADLLEQVLPMGPRTVCDLGPTEPPITKKRRSLGLVCPYCGYEGSYGALSCPGCGRDVDECFRLVSRTRDVLGPYDKGVSCQPSPPPRSRNFRFLYTTYNVNFDDHENYLTTRRERMLGSMWETSTTRGWTLWPPLVAMLALLTLIPLTMISGIVASNALGVVLGILWAILFIPLLLFFLWAAVPPRQTTLDKEGRDKA